MSVKVYSIDLNASFGFFKKPDTNENIYFTYNWLHKPACLGILGAIAGLGGYWHAYEKNSKNVPAFFEKLQSLKIGIKPLKQDDNGENKHKFSGTFEKFIVNYNNSVGYANNGDNLQISEQTIVKPAYRIFIKPEEGSCDHEQLIDRLRKGNAEFIPYMGKNDFQAWWDNFQEYDAEPGFNESANTIDTIFETGETKISLGSLQTFQSLVFEQIPVSYNLEKKSYNLVGFVYTPSTLKKNNDFSGKENKFYHYNNGKIHNIFLF